jgi:hypothetical protein
MSTIPGTPTDRRLIQLASPPDTPAARLAAGILCVASNDPTSAERHFDQARPLGADVGPYLAGAKDRARFSRESFLTLGILPAKLYGNWRRACSEDLWICQCRKTDHRDELTRREAREDVCWDR